MAALERWNDGRLDDLQNEVRELRKAVNGLFDAVGNIGILAERIGGLSERLGEVNKELEDVSGHPSRDKRELRVAITVGVISAFTTGTVGSIVLIIAGGPHP